jgi:hypothetical protein
VFTRIVSCAVVSSVCLFGAAAQDAAPAKPAAPAVTPEQIAAAVKALKDGLASTDVAARIAALKAAAAVDQDDVAKVAGGALTERDIKVRVAAAETLGAMTCKESLNALHRVMGKSDNLKDSPFATACFKAIGRHGDKSSLPVLAGDPFKNTDADVVRARIYGIGNIRATESIDTLLKMMNLANPLPGQDSPFMPSFRVALTRLTGTDQTTNKDLWQKWWRDNGKTFKVADPPGPMPADVTALWNDYWGIIPAAKAAGERGAPPKTGG